jgi:PAS domain S-box-containing protein
VPLLNQAKLTGVLYLENTLTPHVFTPTRRAVLTLLASQAAISLENARLYAERQRAEETVRQSEKQLRDVIETVPAIVWTALPDGSNVFANRGWAEYTGRSAEDTAGAGWQTAAHPEDVERYVEEWHASLATGEPFEGEVRLRAADGVYRWFLARGMPLRDEQGQILRWYGVLTDIEDRKRAEEELQKMQAELAHVTRVTTMGELTSSIAHEVNQPLAAIVMNGNAALRWLAFDPPNIAKARASAEAILSDGERASQFIARTRALLKKAPPQKSPVDINELLQEVLALTHYEVVRSAVPLRTDLEAGLPLPLGDRVQLQQVVLNLVVNAVEAMRGVDGRQRELRIATRKDGADAVRVTVRDTGTGFDPQAAARLFDAFFTTKPKGLGMGLAISRSIIEAHGGRLWAEPNDPHGATFHFTLPTGAEDLS